MQLEEMILENLIANEDYSRKVLPFLKEEYFESDYNRTLFLVIENFILKYNALPPKKSIEMDLSTTKGLSQNVVDNCLKTLVALSDTPNLNQTQWLSDNTEKWCQERAIYLAISKSIQIMDGRNNKDPKTSIPSILSDALAVGFSTDLGHDYIENATDRYDFIHSDIPRIPCDLDMINKITGGGIARKTLNILGAGINVGKSLSLCHLATAYSLAGYKVVYFTLEMSQEEIAKRLDANLMDHDLNNLKGITKVDWDGKIARIKAKSKGNIIIKEYPTKNASVLQFRAFLRELKIKKNFVPDVVIFDYLGICSAAKLKLGGSVNTNTYQGTIAAEMRALMIENNMAGWTAQQLNRTGFSSSDPDLDNVADSFDVPGIADLYLMITEGEELAKLNQYQVIQVKSRYGDKNKNKRFVIGVEKIKMRLYDVAASAQTLIKGALGGNNSGIRGHNVPHGRHGPGNIRTTSGTNDDKFSKFRI